MASFWGCPRRFGAAVCAALTLLLAVDGPLRPAEASGPVMRWERGTCSRPLYFGITPDWPPYQYVSPSGSPLGDDVALIRETAKVLGCPLVVEITSWSRLLSGLLSGKIDVIGGASWTKERARNHHYSSPYRQETLGLFVRSADVGKLTLTGLSSFIGTPLRLGVVADTYIGGEYEKLVDDPAFKKIVVEDPRQDQFALVATKRIDAFLTDSGSGLYSIYRNGLDDTVTLYPGYLLDNGPVYYMFGKASVDASVIAPFNKALEDVLARRSAAGTQQ